MTSSSVAVPPVLPLHPLAPRLRPTPLALPVPAGPGGRFLRSLDLAVGDETEPARGVVELAGPPPPISAQHPGIFWLNSRPYWTGCLLGRGGFGEVHEVEMLLPYGMEVDWGEDGGLRFDETGAIMLKENESRAVSESSVEGGDDGSGMVEQPTEAAGVSQSWMSTLSLTPSEAMWFSLVRREEAAKSDGGFYRVAPATQEHDGHRRSGTSVENKDIGAAGASINKNQKESDPVPEADFPMERNHFLQRSGVFFALKIQKARNKKHLDCLLKEVENLRLLKGKAGTVQLKDHAANENSLHLIILMELGACDLNEFFKQSQWGLDVPSIAHIWRALVDRIESLHESDIIHRDIKPQNFILVPARKGYNDTTILATTSTSREDFVFRLVQAEGGLGKARKEGDVELTIKDTATGEDVVLLLEIKISDFGLALPLDEDAPHVSVFGPNGTVVFMAPEAVRQTVSGCRKVSKRVDIWALGVTLYQMLHKGETPFGHYMIKGGPPEALLAVASETVNREAMDFDATEIWQAERARLLRVSGTGSQDVPEEQQQDPPTTTAEMVHALVVSWVGAEFLVRMCKHCLVFDVNDRVDGEDLRCHIDRAIETGWGLQGDVDVGVVSSSELLQAAFNIDSSREEGAVSVNIRTVDTEVARIGERIGTSLFPGIWMPCQDNLGTLSVVKGGVSGSFSSPSPKVNDKHDPEARPAALPSSSHSESGDSFDRPRRRSFLEILVLVIVSLVVGAGLCAIFGAAIRGSWSGMGGGEGIAIGPSSNDGEEAPRPSSPRPSPFRESPLPDEATGEIVGVGGGGASGGGGDPPGGGGGPAPRPHANANPAHPSSSSSAPTLHSSSSPPPPLSPPPPSTPSPGASIHPDPHSPSFLAPSGSGSRSGEGAVGPSEAACPSSLANSAPPDSSGNTTKGGVVAEGPSSTVLTPASGASESPTTNPAPTPSQETAASIRPRVGPPFLATSPSSPANSAPPGSSGNTTKGGVVAEGPSMGVVAEGGSRCENARVFAAASTALDQLQLSEESSYSSGPATAHRLRRAAQHTGFGATATAQGVVAEGPSSTAPAAFPHPSASPPHRDHLPVSISVSSVDPRIQQDGPRVQQDGRRAPRPTGWASGPKLIDIDIALSTHGRRPRNSVPTTPASGGESPAPNESVETEGAVVQPAEARAPGH